MLHPAYLHTAFSAKIPKIPIVDEARILKALADLDTQDKPSYLATQKKNTGRIELRIYVVTKALLALKPPSCYKVVEILRISMRPKKTPHSVQSNSI